MLTWHSHKKEWHALDTHRAYKQVPLMAGAGVTGVVGKANGARIRVRSQCEASAMLFRGRSSIESQLANCP